ncbi:hypothetical protein DPMN_179304 [Dreissena polymorpha]|uniref:Uncharacterized protein n=1 Tax=Dreissena polymorpha TaxID=45954 RepID=A0A9D4EDR1_DREPO|nr:hypothetical protein DPMN_179304 [Dreissena polymorpha]
MCDSVLCLQTFLAFPLSTGSRGDTTEIDNGRSLEMAKSLTSHHYKSYLVSMVHKLRTNTEVQLGEAFTACARD